MGQRWYLLGCDYSSNTEFRPRPSIYSKVGSSPVLARSTEARCDASRSFLSTYLLADEFIATLFTVIGQSL